MSDGLPKPLRVLRDRLRTAINALDAYDRLLLSGAMGGPDASIKKGSALTTIIRCLRAIPPITKDSSV